MAWISLFASIFTSEAIVVIGHISIKPRSDKKDEMEGRKFQNSPKDRIKFKGSRTVGFFK